MYAEVIANQADQFWQSLRYAVDAIDELWSIEPDEVTDQQRHHRAKLIELQDACLEQKRKLLGTSEQ
jgi:hypothetical protein